MRADLAGSGAHSHSQPISTAAASPAAGLWFEERHTAGFDHRSTAHRRRLRRTWVAPQPALHPAGPALELARLAVALIGLAGFG